MCQVSFGPCQITFGPPCIYTHTYIHTYIHTHTHTHTHTLTFSCTTVFKEVILLPCIPVHALVFFSIVLCFWSCKFAPLYFVFTFEPLYPANFEYFRSPSRYIIYNNIIFQPGYGNTKRKFPIPFLIRTFSCTVYQSSTPN